MINSDIDSEAVVLSPNNQNRSERNKKFSLSWSTHFSPICINSVYWIKFFIQNLIKRVGTRRLYNNKTFSANLLSLYWILLSSPLVHLQDNTGYKKTSRRQLLTSPRRCTWCLTLRTPCRVRLYFCYAIYLLFNNPFSWITYWWINQSNICYKALNVINAWISFLFIPIFFI